jgi:hypothetical protein
MITPILSFTHPDCIYNDNGFKHDGSLTIKVFENTCICEFYPHHVLEQKFISIKDIEMKETDRYYQKDEELSKMLLYARSVTFY